MKETERIKAGLLFRPNSMELRDTKHKAHETCRLVNTLDEYNERIPGLMRSILGKIGERFYFQTPVQFTMASTPTSGRISSRTTTSACWMTRMFTLGIMS